MHVRMQYLTAGLISYYEAGVNSITNTKHCFVYIPICMSDNAWNKIPEDMREPFVNAVQEGCKAQ